jgi:formylglycine-generating enzyme required for sulfatase activity
VKVAFALGKYEITNAQFAAFIEDTGHQPLRACRVWQAGAWQYPEDKDWRDPGYGRPTGPDEAVTCISWRDAKAYTQWLSEMTGEPYRLPTEAEWEYAARAGSATDYFWGNDADEGCAYANLFDRSGAAARAFGWEAVNCDDGFAEGSTVGAFKPNPYGVYDMIGNQWEWTEDCYVAPYPPEATTAAAVQVDGTCERRSVRGGGWITRASRQRLAFRGRDPEDAVYSFFGFRVARDLDATRESLTKRLGI